MTKSVRGPYARDACERYGDEQLLSTLKAPATIAPPRILRDAVDNVLDVAQILEQVVDLKPDRIRVPPLIANNASECAGRIEAAFERGDPRSLGWELAVDSKPAPRALHRESKDFLRPAAERG